MTSECNPNLGPVIFRYIHPSVICDVKKALLAFSKFKLGASKIPRALPIVER
jgi:hypothetical protein